MVSPTARIGSEKSSCDAAKTELHWVPMLGAQSSCTLGPFQCVVAPAATGHPRPTMTGITVSSRGCLRFSPRSCASLCRPPRTTPSPPQRPRSPSSTTASRTRSGSRAWRRRLRRARYTVHCRSPSHTVYGALPVDPDDPPMRKLCLGSSASGDSVRFLFAFFDVSVPEHIIYITSSSSSVILRVARAVHSRARIHRWPYPRPP